MRPISLTLCAFGPFPLQEHVDFQHLGAHGLFLISGPTGSGKTSLLDAMCFALYGRVPGARGELTNDHLRSDHAPTTAATRVTFEFEAGGGRWRVTRAPEQDRPKQRGSGSTRRPATAELERWSGERWEPAASKTGAVNERIGRLVGLSAEQFRTVVLLPQGRFQEALHASTSDRQELLRTLFGTELYRRVTDVLWRRAKEAYAEVAGGSDELARYRADACRHLAELVALSGDGIDDGAAEVELDTVGPLSDRALEVIDARAGEARQIAADARADLERLRALALRWDDHAELQRRRFQLAADEPAALVDRDRLVAAERAATVVEVVEAAIAAGDRSADATGRLAAATARWTAAAEQARALRAPVLALFAVEEPPAEHDDGLVAAVVRAEQAAAEVAALESARAEAVAAESALAAVEASCAAAAERRGDDQRRLAELDGDLALARAAAAPHAELVARLERARIVEAQAVEAALVVQQLEQARSSALEAGREAAQAEQTLAVARRLRDASLAASLAAELRVGGECPVCGSTDHPQPARPPTGVPDPSELAWLETTAAVAQRNLGLAQGEAASLAVRSTELIDTVSVERAVAEVTTLEAAVIAALDANHRVDALVIEQEVLRTDAERAADDERAAVASRSEWSQRLSHARAQVERHLGTVSAVCGNADPTEVVAAARLLRSALSDTVAARADVAGADDELCRARELEARSLVASGFADRASWSAAHLDAASREQLHESIRVREEELARVAGRLEAIVAGPPLPAERPDVDQAELLAAVAVSRAQELEQHLGDARRLHLLVDEAVRAADEAAGGLEQARARAATVEAVAAACRGGGGQPGLETWVLAVVLREVALAANLWLAQLSDGRYQLQLGGPTSARGQTGLELAVLDAHTGVVRPVQTLSGGETFQASLALALGLADVVGAHSGGVSLDALFIDEGFGSLDRDALEQAVQQLEHLRAGGRLVGVISHVDALGERLPTGIQLQRCGVGSTVVQPLRDDPTALGAGT